MRAVGGQLADERAHALREVGGVLTVVAVARAGVESGAHALEREQPALRRDDLERVHGRGAPAHRELGGGVPVDGDAERARDVVGAAGREQRRRRQRGKAEVRERVDGAIAADQDDAAVAGLAHGGGELALVPVSSASTRAPAARSAAVARATTSWAPPAPLARALTSSRTSRPTTTGTARRGRGAVSGGRSTCGAGL